MLAELLLGTNIENTEYSSVPEPSVLAAHGMQLQNDVNPSLQFPVTKLRDEYILIPECRNTKMPIYLSVIKTTFILQLEQTFRSSTGRGAELLHRCRLQSQGCSDCIQGDPHLGCCSRGQSSTVPSLQARSSGWQRSTESPGMWAVLGNRKLCLQGQEVCTQSEQNVKVRSLQKWIFGKINLLGS